MSSSNPWGVTLKKAPKRVEPTKKRVTLGLATDSPPAEAAPAPRSNSNAAATNNNAAPKNTAAPMPKPKEAQQAPSDEEKEAIAAKMVAVSGGYLRVPTAMEIVEFPPEKIGDETIHRRIRRMADRFKKQGIVAEGDTEPPVPAAVPAPAAVPSAMVTNPEGRNSRKNRSNAAPTSNATPKNAAAPAAAAKKNDASPKKAAPPPAAAAKKPVNASPKKEVPAAKKKNDATKPAASCPGVRGAAQKKKEEGVPDEYQDANPSKWRLVECRFSGSTSYSELGNKELVQKPIDEGIENFKANPGKYVALTYQAGMEEWPNNQKYTLIHRMGTVNYKPKGVDPNGAFKMLMWEYQALPPLKDDVLPAEFRDKWTDSMTHQGMRLHSNQNKPMLPGRGMGICDNPLIKIIGDVDPSDIHQGAVGDCWLLSAISALAEFDGAVKKLFQKTKNLDKRPFDEPNQYIVTLWDLPTWKEVDIVIDERLPVMADGSRRLLASKPSEDGELWVCYLEKALAIHCGGWDKITGGQCTHGWSLMTGCKHQYMIKKNAKSGKYGCFAKYNPMEKDWSRHANCPHEGDNRMWPVSWPEVGGGGCDELTEDDLFLKMVAWDKENYIVGASTKGTSDKNTAGGLVDNHAYSVIESHSNVCGTGIDLLKVRNPWGKGEIEDGEFDDDGPGWDKYPQIKKKLNPVVADDGIFWVTKKEFFVFYLTIYLSASNMTEFLED